MPPKRKAAAPAAADGDEGLRRSTRRKSSAPAGDDAAPAAQRPPAAVKKEPRKKEPVGRQDKKTTKGVASRPKAKAELAEASKKPQPGDDVKDENTGAPAATSTEAGAAAEKSYWLLKAEPETRLEAGVDVKFSIDDLAARTEPEPWDGIRNYVARNNLRAMRKGDLAFFYHSNCKEPGIVGTMEIVREHSSDLSAHDPKAPYYDPKSKPEDPKWSVVHVEFRSKFAQQIGLKELREMGKPGRPLENMQLLKQSRLSVSRVSAAEWEYLTGVAEERGGAAAA